MINGIDYRAYAYDGDDCPRVKLTEWEHLRADQQARCLRGESLAAGKTEHHHDPTANVSRYNHVRDKGLHVHWIGAIAELAAAKALNCYWPGHVNVGKRVSDLPGNVEVRLVGVDYYGLRVRDSDDDDKYIVGVVMPEGHEFKPVRVLGWVLAGEAKYDCWAMNPNDGRPMYAVPQVATSPAWALQQILMGDGILSDLPRIPDNGRRNIHEVAAEITEMKRCKHEAYYVRDGVELCADCEQPLPQPAQVH